MIETHVLISLEARHADGILDNKKRVELRRRSMRIPIGTTVWFYAKLPVGEVVGCARIQCTHSLAPTTLWKRFGPVSGLSRAEFFSYFDGVSKGFALVLERPRRLANGVSLNELRSLVDGFQPPQFFQHLTCTGPLVTAFAGEAKDSPVPFRHFSCGNGAGALSPLPST